MKKVKKQKLIQQMPATMHSESVTRISFSEIFSQVSNSSRNNILPSISSTVYIEKLLTSISMASCPQRSPRKSLGTAAVIYFRLSRLFSRHRINGVKTMKMCPEY